MQDSLPPLLPLFSFPSPFLSSFHFFFLIFPSSSFPFLPSFFKSMYFILHRNYLLTIKMMEYITSVSNKQLFPKRCHLLKITRPWCSNSNVHVHLCFLTVVTKWIQMFNSTQLLSWLLSAWYLFSAVRSLPFWLFLTYFCSNLYVREFLLVHLRNFIFLWNFYTVIIHEIYTPSP